MPRIIIESPYAGDTTRNLAYARRAMLDSIERGESPVAFHLLYTQILDDDIEAQRNQGIFVSQGFYSPNAIDLVAVYDDLGISSGMKLGIERASRVGIPVEFRGFGDYKDNTPLTNAEVNSILYNR